MGGVPPTLGRDGFGPGTLFFQDVDPPEATSEAKPKVLSCFVLGTLFFQDFDPPEATSEAKPKVLSQEAFFFQGPGPGPNLKGPGPNLQGSRGQI